MIPQKLQIYRLVGTNQYKIQLLENEEEQQMLKLEFEYDLTQNENIFNKEDEKMFEHEQSLVDVRDSGCVNIIKTFFHKDNKNGEMCFVSELEDGLP